MGAEYFERLVRKSEEIVTVQEAFVHATSDARYMHGHGGYTGTIAEKHEFMSRNDGVAKPLSEAYDFAHKDGEHNDKWGPAYYVTVTGMEDDEVIGWLFYGWASC
jgi:hypothetical protein